MQAGLDFDEYLDNPKTNNTVGPLGLEGKGPLLQGCGGQQSGVQASQVTGTSMVVL